MNKDDLNYEPYQSDTDKLLDAARRQSVTGNFTTKQYPLTGIPSLKVDCEPGYVAREQLAAAKELIYRMRQVIWSVIQWNDEYRHLNNLSGDPSWVQTAYDVFMDSRPK